MATPNPLVIMIGLTPDVQDLVQKHTKDGHHLSRKYDGDILETPISGHIGVIVCGTDSLSIPVIEVGQTFRMLYPDSTIFFVTKERNGFNRPDFHKNGFNDGFLFPSDKPELVQNIESAMAIATSGKTKAYKKIQLIDVAADATLGFDLYLHLPAANKKIRYVSSTESLGPDRSEKLRKHNYRSALITVDQAKEFYQFTARQLKAMNNATGMSETERQEKQAAAVRDLLTGLFSDNENNLENGREMMEDCQEIVKAYVNDDSKGSNSWYEKIIAAGASNSESTVYSHAATTSTFGALLSIALGIGDPKDAALAALLHDIGLADVPEEIINKSPTEWTPAERARYEQHTVDSVRLIKERRMNVDEKICNIIAQHHERFDGTGYPNKLAGPRILPEAQILAVADRLDELTSIKDGVGKLSVIQAMELICSEGLANPIGSPINPDILRKIKSIFLMPKKEAV